MDQEEKVSIQCDVSDIIVFYDWASRMTESPDDSSKLELDDVITQVLANLVCDIEAQLALPLYENYGELLDDAKKKVSQFYLSKE